MRIFSYKDEKTIVCDNCGTKLAYSPDIDIHTEYTGESVDTVKNALKWICSDVRIYNQLKKEQLYFLKKHLEWVCLIETESRYVFCPVCNEKLNLTEKILNLYGYPQDSIDEDSGEQIGDSFNFCDFNKPKDD